jgi:hypothetical protein
MNLNKIKSIIQKISKEPNVKKVIDDIQAATAEAQSKLNSINTSDAVKKYKDLMKMLSAKEKQLQKEILSVVNQAKKTASEVEKNLAGYKKKAKTQRAKLEKAIKVKANQFSPAKTAKKSVKKTAVKKKAVKKKATRKA